MKKQVVFLQCIIAMCCVNQIFAQIKLKELNDFKEPRGDWFQASEVSLDSLNTNQFIYTSGKGIFVNGDTGKTKHLTSKEAFGDIELHLEFMVPKGSNSGIYFQSRYEIQILDSWGKDTPEHSDCGGIYQRWDESKPEKNKGYEGIPPRVNACKAPGEWQSYDIIFRAPRFDADGNKIKNAVFEKVVLNGVVIHENKEVTGATREGSDAPEQAFGPLRIQGDHGRVALKNIRIRKLDNIRASKPNEWVDLFEDTKSGPNYDFVVNGDATQEEANAMFDYSDGSLKAMYKWNKTTAPYGIAVTKKLYSSYDLKLEFKWGERRFAPRLEKVRDAGLLYHSQVGTYAWPPSLEYQIQEGDCGDLWSILGCRCDVVKDGNISKIKVADYSSSVKWTDEEKEGWNEVLIEVRKDKAKYYLNGVLINEITNANYGGLTCTSGFIALQAEYAELIYRNIKIKEL
ncbi:DUF1080 domain-containing protein [Flavivirga aquimarina]|uniref:DUF1080 domain-containing protein n=1 Tax=Flavivirga aquimarina TaxID=2027862 RepID=A0ABT8WF44_9FLAO|nr:DUF1080 domain-containing protein [Flavivirga aquimarina]MDO5971785.1 DUF1080 domain-containing protein [Flavivirga aquimarina]